MHLRRMPFHTVHGVLKARILKWFAIPISGDFFKKIRDTKGTFHAKMGTIKDRKSNKSRRDKEKVRRIHTKT